MDSVDDEQASGGSAKILRKISSVTDVGVGKETDELTAGLRESGGFSGTSAKSAPIKASLSPVNSTWSNPFGLKFDLNSLEQPATEQTVSRTPTSGSIRGTPAAIERAIGLSPDSEDKQRWNERRQRMLERSKHKLKFQFLVRSAMKNRSVSLAPDVGSPPTAADATAITSPVANEMVNSISRRDRPYPSSVPANPVVRFDQQFAAAAANQTNQQEEVGGRQRSNTVSDMRSVGTGSGSDDKETVFEILRKSLRAIPNRMMKPKLFAAQTPEHTASPGQTVGDPHTSPATKRVLLSAPEATRGLQQQQHLTQEAVEEQKEMLEPDFDDDYRQRNAVVSFGVAGDDVFDRQRRSGPSWTDERRETHITQLEGAAGTVPLLHPKPILKHSRHQPILSTSSILHPKFGDWRPYFTWWITTVQVVVFIIAWSTYGFGPFGFESRESSRMVMTTALALETVDYREPSNFWWGPRAQDLVHLGAKYTPCMRSEKQIKLEMEQLREQERKSACCIRNDGSGCVQSTEDDCSKSISRWVRCPGAVGCIPGDKWTGGTVCGLDPRYCIDTPLLLASATWNQSDITTWPKCRSVLDQYQASCDANGTNCNALALTTEPHMKCERVGRPCCYGIRGQCRLATREFCDFVHGFYHEDAFLCSQVSCLEQVCGMIPFLHANKPDQVYRVFTSLFLHAGVIQLGITLFIHFVLMTELEKLYGWWRVALIYLLSGMTGNMVSAIFLPDVPEVGPSSSLFAIWGLWMVEEYDEWKKRRERNRESSILEPHSIVHSNHPLELLLSAGFFASIFMVLGLLPWIDNFAQISGFGSGIALAFFCIPYGAYELNPNISLWRKRLRKYVPFAAFLLCVFLLLVAFYVIPLDKDTWPVPLLLYVNCIPFTEDFCGNQNSYFFPKGYSTY